MNRNLVKLIFVLLFTAITSGAMAQEKGDIAVGGNLVSSSDGEFTNYGVGAKFQWNLLKQLRLEPSYTYFLEKDNISMWDMSLNAHYLIPVANKITLYPLAGLGMAGVKWHDSNNTDSVLGVNIGGGVDFKITDKLILDLRLKALVIGDFSTYADTDSDLAYRLMLSAGVAYKF